MFKQRSEEEKRFNNIYFREKIWRGENIGYSNQQATSELGQVFTFGALFYVNGIMCLIGLYFFFEMV